jgi:hypothetical protein
MPFLRTCLVYVPLGLLVYPFVLCMVVLSVSAEEEACCWRSVRLKHVVLYNKATMTLHKDDKECKNKGRIQGATGCSSIIRAIC